MHGNPEKFFKALLICDNQEWFSIGFVMNNDDDPQIVHGSMLTVNDLERLIGLDLYQYPAVGRASQRR